MAGALTLYLLVVAAMVVCFAAAYAYYEAAAMPVNALPLELTARDVAGVTVAALAVVVSMGVLGDVAVFDPETDVRGLGMLVVGAAVPLVLGLVALASSRTLAGRWRRLHPDDDVPTGRLSPGRVACTGTVTDETAGTAPVTDRAACCWAWEVEVRDPHGVEGLSRGGEQWVVRDGGVGGVRFAVDDGSGPVWVDPADATVDLGNTRTLALDADERPPEDFPNPAPKVERDHRDKSRRYEESVAAPGDLVAVAGTARRTDDGLTVDAGHVAVGSLSTAATRYRNRAVMYGLAGLVGVAVGVRALAGVLDVV
ncbi:hypothetical protein [Haloarcula marina]|uniref:hypothetical protein n=1 Tax=Haloarcula marina TaxID=2961574 RepID=UPI0020B6F9FA|nr:hypothetical protein [Halomicroarcula marina]